MMGTEAEPTATLGENRSEWPEVNIVVLNWNNYEDTSDCLADLENLDYPNYNVIVVDNGSTDDSGEKLSREFEYPKYIFNSENIGFAGGNNLGIRSALERESDYVLLLNNDTRVKKNFLIPLIQTLESREDTVIASGVIREVESGDIWYSGGSFCKPLIRPTIDKTEPNSRRRLVETDHVTGALMCISSNFLREFGLLDDSYFFSFEDTEICHRARKNGYRIVVDTKVEIMHKVGSSAGSNNPFRYYHNTINRLQFASKELDRIEQIMFYLYLTISRGFHLTKWIPRDDTSKKAMATILATKDWYSGRKPRSPSEFPL